MRKHLYILAVLLFAATAQAKRPQPPPEPAPGPQVYDKFGQQVGHLLDTNGHAAVLLPLDGRFFRLTLTPESFGGGAVLEFETADCSGTAYVNGSEGFTARGVISYPAGLLYAATGPRVEMLRGSRLHSHGFCEVAPAGSLEMRFPLEPLVDLHQVFPPPYEIR